MTLGGQVRSLTPSGDAKRLIVCADGSGVQLGDSIAINGVCLTVVHMDDKNLAFDVVPESLLRSNLGDLQPGDKVNVELSLRVGDALGGHLVYGHVDATSEILLRDEGEHGFLMWCATPPALAPMIVEKGYVALDGVSLTVAYVKNGMYAVALIPETRKRTTLGRKGVGARLNIEADPVARYVAAMLGARHRAAPEGPVAG